MGIKVKRARATAVRLEKMQVETTRQLRRVHRDGSYMLAEVAREMTPYKEGVLESSVEVGEERGVRGRKVFTVSAYAVNPKTGFVYSTWIHEGIYDLGKDSIAKQQRVRHKVGRKFMERATRWIIDVWGLHARAEAAVQRAIARHSRR